MNSVRMSLAKKITEANPALDIQGSDRKVLQVAFQDFTNYFKFSWKRDDNRSDCDVVVTMEQYMRNETEEFDSFITVWVGIWLNKWKARVKLLFGNQNQSDPCQVSKPPASAELIWENLACKNEMKEIVISSLIRNAEICGTEILAENILKRELSKTESQEINDKQLVVLINNALCKTREMSQRIGPLIFVRIDQAYYSH